uniref:COBRA C-terminal domain-containing protein n=1 Tax=Leersia perrieri TaxID=77586 RepID=A0A0D9X373_9ORYZ
MAVLIVTNSLPRYAVLFAAVFLLAAAQAQPQPAMAPAPEPDCNGILLTYNFDRREKIRPFVAVPNAQPYSFHATAAVRNSGVHALRSWTLLITFAHGEILVAVDGAVLTSGADLPYNTTASDGAGNATSFTGYPQTDLLTPIATAGDLTKILATVSLVGTLFAVPEPYVPLPSEISLADPSYTCPKATNVSATSLSTCCVLTSAAVAGDGDDDDLDAARTSPRGNGDMVITYDVLQAYETRYVAQVTMENDALLGRLDGWELTWQWLRGEFISSMRGAYPRQVDVAECVYGRQGASYKELDFSNVLNCDRRPAVVDLPPSRRDDTVIGMVNHCCRNGTILPKSVDAAQSKSAFQMEVYKMPPDLNRTKLYPPANFRVSGDSPMNPEYACGQPVRVSPTEIPDTSGLASNTLALATWQVVCNVTTATAKAKTPSCCVTFSAFYNESVIPCSTCACGCPANAAATCSATAASMLLPPYALLMPSGDRRAREAVKWAGEKRLGPTPSPMPCGDNCGVSINWHVATDFAGGWTARATLFNWQDDVDVTDWFMAVVMGKQAYDGFEQAFSFNATAIGNGTTMILMQGMEGFGQYLKRESNMSGVDYPVAGKQQSVLLFNKKKQHESIDVVAGDGFPSRVLFNGHECAMPQRIPSGAHRRRRVFLSLPHLASVSSILLLLSLL